MGEGRKGEWFGWILLTRNKKNIVGEKEGVGGGGGGGVGEDEGKVVSQEIVETDGFSPFSNNLVAYMTQQFRPHPLSHPSD